MGIPKESINRGTVLLSSLDAIVLEYKPDCTGDGMIILCLIPKRQEFVTWYLTDEGNTVHGHYFKELGQALYNYHRRS